MMEAVLWTAAAGIFYLLYKGTVPDEEAERRAQEAREGEPTEPAGEEEEGGEDSGEPIPLRGGEEGPSGEGETGDAFAEDAGAGVKERMASETANPFRPAHKDPDFKGSFDDIEAEPDFEIDPDGEYEEGDEE